MLRTKSVRSASSQLKLYTGSFAQPRRGIVTETDVEKARAYCVNQLRHGDYEAYLIRRFLPPSAQDAYDAFRTLNLELARLPETVSNPLIGQMRMQFWRDSINSTFAGNPPREPISILLHKVISDLGRRGSPSSIKFWLLRLLSTREQYMDNRPFASLAVLEDYGENTYATLMYATLAATGLRSLHVDHLASHIGKACGIAAILRGVPVLAAPRPPVQSPLGENSSNAGPALLLPLDVMAKAGVREEDVFRRGPEAPGLQDAIFEVATRANDHLITAREMLKNLKAGQNPGHDFEHEGESEHVYDAKDASAERTKLEVQRGFGTLLEAIPAADFLQRLENANFDPFRVKSSWKLPWSLWRAAQKQQI
ncbi:hypothetical protein MCOR07_006262 [Pyricularia oryzae]|uniref:Squalene/phytoene synthase n=2 Tax=Pyricularia TaxID=48558 RepID=A0ABQ8NBV1_PYRGI|nr:hypothetical protein MCOR26_010915 [Pyricularia oryzae]KAI6294617.1 hypothetical protein MCOR33_008322 [Pyricularia grisea]KAI6312354.1 hypothetical protein MCOR30_010582 [Pyricularia oryzae]KAI6317430.1 hypothetical protein MCOR29_006326 [Pyricularia oryzae]KAI6332651.1 hypothetical protein MCOR28_010783 [Pyricularia oryzae]